MVYVLAGLGGILVGFSKAGLKGLGTVVVALLAISFGAKPSTGILLPLFLMADIFAVYYYNRYARWEYLIHFLPTMMIGVVCGAYFGRDIPEDSFKLYMAAIVLITLVIMIYFERISKLSFADHWLFASTVGVAAGFTTMLGNLAGPLSNLYFLATKLPKNEFIGTAAWLFFIINIFKMPFHIFVWHTIDIHSLKQSLMLVPFVLVGFMVGLRIVSLISNQWYRNFIIVVTAISAILIYFQ